MAADSVLPLKAAVFDLDDTLVAFDLVTEPSWTAVCGSFCAGRSDVCAGKLHETIRAASGRFWSDPERHRVGRNRLAETRREIVREAFEELGMEDAAAAIRLADEYSRVRTDAMYLFEGARETLLAARGLGLKTAVLTNGESSVQREKLERFDLEMFFDGIFIEGELGYGKPDPRVYRDVLAFLGTRAEETIIVGDNPEWEIRVPGELGFRTCFFNSRNLDVSGTGIAPDYTASSLGDVTAILKRVSGGRG